MAGVACTECGHRCVAPISKAAKLCEKCVTASAGPSRAATMSDVAQRRAEKRSNSTKGPTGGKA